MPEENHKARRRPRLLAATISGAILVLLLAVALWRISQPHLQAWIQAKLSAQITRITGGHAELKSVEWNLWKLEFDLRDVTVYGREPSAEPPYLHVRRLLVRAKIISLLRRQLGLNYLQMERPVLHVVIYPNGGTNIPTPAGDGAGSNAAVRELFDVAVSHVEVKDGVLLLNHRKLPLDFSARNVGILLAYVPAESRYDGLLRVGGFEGKYGELRPVSGSVKSEFSLWKDRARLQSLTLNSGESVVQASGELHGWFQPKVELSYSAALDVAQWGRMAGAPEWRSGRLMLEGHGQWQPEGFSSTGQIAMHSLDYADRRFRAENISGSSDFTLASDKLRLPHLSASVLGGKVEGSIEITNWRNSHLATRNGEAGGKTANLQSGVAHLRLSGILVSRLAAALSTPAMPLRRARLAGTSNGTLNVRWQGAVRNAIAALALDISPPLRTAPGELPVAGMVRGTYQASKRQVSLEELKVATRSSRLEVSGTLGAGPARLSVAANTTDLGEWRGLWFDFGGLRQLPIELRGRATFRGEVGGRIAEPAVAGHLAVTDFDTLIAPRPLPGSRAAAVASGTHRVHWDSASADVEYSPNAAAVRNAMLRHGSAHVAFDFSTRLRRGAFDENMPFSLQANVSDAAVGDVLGITSYSYPITGTLNMNLQAAGTTNELQGSGHLSLSNAQVHGESFRRISSDVRFFRGEAQFTRLELIPDGALISGSAAYDWRRSSFRFDLQGANLRLEKIRRLENSRVNLAGVLNFKASGSGTLDEPTINGNAQVQHLVVNGERIGAFTLTAATTNDVLQLQMHSSAGPRGLVLQGTARLRGEYPASFTIRMDHLDMDPVIRAFLKGRVTAHSSVAGTIHVHGPLRRPQDLSADGNIEAFSAGLEHVQLRNETPIRFTVAGQVLRFEQFRLGGTGTSITGRGRVQLSEPQTLDLGARGTLNLQLLRSLSPDLVSYGQVSFNVHLGGEISRPLVDGAVEVAGAGLSYVNLPAGLSDINGKLTFNQDRLQVVKLTAKTGGGTLDISGFVTYGQRLMLNLGAVAKDVRLRYPPGVSSMANANLRLAGSLDNALLSGEITVTRFGVNPQFDFSQYLVRAKQPLELSTKETRLSRLRLDLHVVSTPELQVQTSLAKISGDMDLRLRGTAARPVVLGRVNIVEGNISFNGTQYRLQRGDITFSNPVRLEPVVDMQATTTVRGYEITLGFHGPLNKLSTTYRSDPPLATPDIVSLLAFGRTREESALQQAQNQKLPETASYAILGRALDAAVGSRVQRLFGVSRIKIDPQPQTTGVAYNTAGPTVTIEQQVANKLTITYISNLSRTNYQSIQAEYNVNRNLSIIAVRDWNGIVSFDVRIRQRKR